MEGWMKRRLTRQRKAILDILRGRRDHPTADQLFMVIRRVMPRISLGTVYRNLDVLRQMGFVRVISAPGEPRRFDGNESVHEHFRCTVCGVIYDIPAEMKSEPARSLPGFIVQKRVVELIGVCPRCNCSVPDQREAVSAILVRGDARITGE